MEGNQTENTSIMEEEGGNTHTTIEMSRLESSDLSMSRDCCIFKTPKVLFRHNEKAFLPIAFAIGPLHHAQKNLKPTEKIKRMYMEGLVSRSGIEERKLIEAIDKIGKEASESYAGPVIFSKDDFVKTFVLDGEFYAGPVELSKDDFVKMLVLDGCFIIELFRKNAHEQLIDANDPIFNTCSLHQCLLHDLILLENQIPWKVLEVLFNMTTPNCIPLYRLAIKFYEDVFSYQYVYVRSLIATKYRSKHILDLLRNWLVLSSEEEGSNQSKGGDWQSIPSATKLKEAGVKFKNVTNRNILGVKFRNGTLEIPSLLIDEVTETAFRNLISFEQCSPNYPPIFTSYAILMDNLIDTTKDMEILLEENIIENWLNPADATESFNKLFTDALLREFYYHDLCKEVNKYCRRRWPRWRAYITHKYFNNPWAIVGVVVGGLIFFFTFIQTVCSVIQTVKLI